MSNVLPFPTEKLQGPVSEILESMKAEDLHTIIIIGRSNDGFIHWGSSSGDLADIYWLLGRISAYVMVQ